MSITLAAVAATAKTVAGTAAKGAVQAGASKALSDLLDKTSQSKGQQAIVTARNLTTTIMQKGMEH